MAALSGCHWRQADGDSIAQRGDGFQRHVAGALDGPFVVLLEQEGADEVEDGGFVRENPDDIAATLDLAVQPLERVCAVQFGAVLGGEVHVGENICLGIVHQAVFAVRKA